MTESRTTSGHVTPDLISINSESISSDERRFEPKKTINGTKYRKVISKNEKIRKLDEAICELEAIYASLNLDDEDLLDRAERRDMPSKFQLMRSNSMETDGHQFSDITNGQRNGFIVKGRQIESQLNQTPTMAESMLPVETGWTHPHCDEFCLSRSRHRNLGFVESLLSSSDPPYRYRAPARRRSAIPDPVNDDLAARKMVKNRGETIDKSIEGKKIQSYLLISPIYSPSNRDGSDDESTMDNYLSTEPRPDIEKDDLSYRKFIQSDAASVTPAHPPFGIPIGLTDLATINNYVQASLSEKDRNFFYYRVKPYYPHLVKDDMAFRSFRKDLDKSHDDLRKSWTNGIKLLPVTTNHLINQRNQANNRPSSADLIENHQVHYYYHPHHQYPTQSFISSGFEHHLSSLV